MLVLVMAGFGFGANTATVNSDGNGNSADIAQTGSNTADIEQIGNSQTATIGQNGTDNDGMAEQYGNGNASDIAQVGSTNSAWTGQLDGDGNTADIDQDGTGNGAWVTQGMVENYYSDPNYQPSTSLPGNSNSASIDQGGANNVGDVIQVGSGNAIDVDQSGSSNTAIVYQGWAFGFWGETPVTSALSSYNSTVTINQNTGDNYSAVWQYGGDNNSIAIDQQGAANRTQIAQGFIYEDANYDFPHPIYNTNNNGATINQVGTDNSAKMFQLGDNNSFTLNQNGASNTVGGRGLSGLEAIRNGYFDQGGNDNEFTGTQNDGATLDDKSYQYGDSNDIDLIQNAGDVALIQQDGNSNNANNYQYGGGQSSSIIQTGDSNNASVTQN